MMLYAETMGDSSRSDDENDDWAFSESDEDGEVGGGGGGRGVTVKLSNRI